MRGDIEQLGRGETAPLGKPWWWAIALADEYDLPRLRRATRGKKRLKFETVAEALAENEKRIRVLEVGSDPAAMQLAAKLRRCSPRNPCNSSACRFSTREFRRTITGMALMVLAPLKPIRVVTLIFGRPYRTDWLQGTDPAPDLKSMVQKVRMDLRRYAPNIEVWIGGVEFDLDSESGMAEPHVHLIVVVKNKRDLRALKAFYKRTAKGIYRPAHVSKRIRRARRPRAVSYSWKYTPARKERYKTVDSAGKHHHHSDKYRLKGPAARRALLYLDRYRPEDFIILAGMRRRGVRFILTAPSLSRKNLKGRG